MGDRLRVDMPARYVTSRLGQLSLLPSVGREKSSIQSAVMHCMRLGSKGRMAHSIRG